MHKAMRFQYEGKLPHAENNYDEFKKDIRHGVSRARNRDKLREVVKNADNIGREEETVRMPEM